MGSRTSRPEVAVGAVVLCRGALLLVRRARPPAAGCWSVPGGRVEAGETLAAAVVRELAEEAGVQGRCGAFVGWTERIDPEAHSVILDFLVDVDPSPTGELPDLRAGDDADDARWVPLDRVGAQSLVPGLATFLTEHEVLPPSTPG